MSVELTESAMNVLPANPKKGHENTHKPLNSLASLEADFDNNVAVNKTIRAEINTIEENESKPSQNQEEFGDKKEVITTPQLENVAKQLQEFIGKMNRGLEFTVDEDSGRDVIKVIDKNSGDIIKQYPSEEVLSLVAKLSEATGNFVDSKV